MTRFARERCVVPTKKARACVAEVQDFYGEQLLPVCHIHNPNGAFALQHPATRAWLLRALILLEAGEEQLSLVGTKRNSVDATREREVVRAPIRTVACPHCGARAGDRCLSPRTGQTRAAVHPERKRAWQQAKAPITEQQMDITMGWT